MIAAATAQAATALAATALAATAQAATALAATATAPAATAPAATAPAATAQAATMEAATMPAATMPDAPMPDAPMKKKKAAKNIASMPPGRTNGPHNVVGRQRQRDLVGQTGRMKLVRHPAGAGIILGSCIQKWTPSTEIMYWRPPQSFQAILIADRSIIARTYGRRRYDPVVPLRPR
jgi:hypothetical protein